VALDVDHAGAAVTRQRALDAVRTELVAFLDDDDYFYPNHLEVLFRMIKENDAQYAYSWFDGNNPFPGHRGKQMDPNSPHHTTMTVLVRTELAKEAGFRNHPDENDVWPGEDWQFTLRCLQLGGKFIGTGETTWFYAVHGGNTSGLPKWQ
jgi:glycosyltransferase involved in cell wall biosynthesis